MLHPNWFKFFPQDFESDGKVSGMSLAACGAYIRLLCKAWRETPPATIPQDDATLARWVGATADEWERIKGEVLAAFRPANGRLIQKRLARSYKEMESLRDRRVEAGRIGGFHKHESRAANAEGDFDTFWKAYPRKIAKAKATAERAWKKINPDAALQAVILEALDRQRQCPQWQEDGGKFIPYPGKWLTQKCWEDAVDVDDDYDNEFDRAVARLAKPMTPEEAAQFLPKPGEDD